MKDSRFRTASISVLVTLVVLGGIGSAIVYSGAYNIAAIEPHFGITQWLFETAQHRSVAVRADEVGGPPPLDEAALAHGLEHFQNTCVVCHGAPGVDRGEIGQGINPLPPALAEAAEEWELREVFWITKNGIKLAGMPAFGPTHSDAEIWEIAAVVDSLPNLTPEEYQQWVDRAVPGAGEQGAAPHTH